MAQFDVHRMPNGGMVIDCQSDLHSHFGSRFVVPLIPLGKAAPMIGRLHPCLAVHGSEFVMATHLSTAVRERDLGPALANLSQRRLDIIGAIDVLVTGV